jgi:biopolymer transport protein ExbD
MRFKRHLEVEQGFKKIDMLPLINVLFLLFIFFMFASGFVAQSGIRVMLPKALTSEVVRYENIEITIVGDSAIYLNNRRVDLEELKVSLKNLSERKGTVLIKADKSSPLAMAVQICDLCREAGFDQINIATN